MEAVETPAETAVWINGKKFVEFLEEKGINRKTLSKLVASSDMKNKGANISVWRADRILTKFGYHIRELPDDAWLPNYVPSSSAWFKRREKCQ